MGLEYIVQKASNFSKNDGKILKGQRSQFKVVPMVQVRKNGIIKINNNGERS